MSGTPALELSGLSCGYGRVPVLRDVDLSVRRGEVVALLGANGAGKTTLLLAVGGILRVSAGTVTMLGERLRGPAHRISSSGVRLVLDRNLFMRQTVLENLRVAGVDPERAFAIFPALSRLAKRRAGLLSGGEQKMLSLGRALASDPTVMLIDEVSLGLAPVVVAPLLEAIKRAADDGLSVLLVEQQVSRALDVAARGYVLNQGRVVIHDSSEALQSNVDEITKAYLA